MLSILNTQLAPLLLLQLSLLLTAIDGKYIWDILKKPLSTAEVAEMLKFAVPGVDYPNYSTPPDTGFRCKAMGFYADVDARCQVIRRCTPRRLYSFLCPNSTLFNQATLVCDWWYNVNCGEAEGIAEFSNQYLYVDGADLFDSPPPTTQRRGSARRISARRGEALNTSRDEEDYDRALLRQPRDHVSNVESLFARPSYASRGDYLRESMSYFSQLVSGVPLFTLR